MNEEMRIKNLKKHSDTKKFNGYRFSKLAKAIKGAAKHVYKNYSEATMPPELKTALQNACEKLTEMGEVLIEEAYNRNSYCKVLRRTRKLKEFIKMDGISITKKVQQMYDEVCDCLTEDLKTYNEIIERFPRRQM